MKRRTYRTRPLRGKNKAHTVNNEQTATLLQWVTTYPMMLTNARCWFANWRIPQSDLQDVYKAGFHGLAIELGYQPYRKPVTVDFSQPIVTSIPQVEKAAA